MKIKEHVTVVSFDEVMLFAISTDLSRLKAYRMMFADRTPKVEELLDQHKCRPQLVVELQVLWPLPTPGLKRRRAI